ncbi:hypothetical protein C8Q76DRAFT_748180 [Earliella scabrosa]|nr:hypothetical protein C8Q76DRAFT_748180 [Earliella scabrosa]
MSFSALLQRVQRGLSTLELVHTSHPRWPLPPTPGPHLAPTLHISVLDSSFNPPTLAHLALANLRPSQATPNPSATPSPLPDDFDARLLLLSVRNVDKQLKPRDAIFEQRMEMMVLLAHDLELARTLPSPSLSSAPSTSPSRAANVAVAIIDEPTFVGKSAILLDFLRRRIAELDSPAPSLSLSPSPSPSPKLTFLMGTDTIVRLFASRYYADEQAMKAALHRFLSPTEDDSRVICARRVGYSKGVTGAVEEQLEVEIPDILRDVVPADKIVFADIGEKERTYSSSEVRETIARHDSGWKTMVTEGITQYILNSNLYLVAPQS